jgi:hypothetical protein
VLAAGLAVCSTHKRSPIHDTIRQPPPNGGCTFVTDEIESVLEQIRTAVMSM